MMLRKEIKSKFQLLAPLFWSKFEVFHEKVAGKVLKLDETLAPPDIRVMDIKFYFPFVETEK